MKKTLLGSAVIGGMAALTIGLAAPVFAAPAVTAPVQSSEILISAPHEFPRIQNNTEKVDRRDNQRFSTEVRHPVHGSLGPIVGWR